MDLIQTHLDKYGVKEAEFARRIGTSPQTVSNWKLRGTTLPTRRLLEGVAEVTGLPYPTVLGAALADAGYWSPDDIKNWRPAARLKFGRPPGENTSVDRRQRRQQGQ